MTDWRRIIILTASLLAVDQLGALTTIGDGDLLLEVDSRITYDSNIFVNATEEDDFVLAAQPMLVYRREQSLIHSEIGAGVELLKFIDNDDFDSANVRTYFELSAPHGIDNPNWFAAIYGGFNQFTEAYAVNANLEEFDLYNLNAYAAYYFSEAFGIKFEPGVRYHDTDTTGFVDRTRYTAATGLLYEPNEALAYEVTYRYRLNDIHDANPDLSSQDHAVFAGVEGGLSENLTLELRLGAQHRVFENSFDDSTEPYFFAGAAWQSTERLEITLEAEQDFGTASSNLSENVLSIELGARYTFDEQLTFFANGGWEDAEFLQPNETERRDDAWTLSGGARYDFTEQLSAEAEVGVETRDSTSPFSAYNRLRATLGIAWAL